MNSQIIRLLLLSCLIFQYGCDISLKRKDKNHKVMAPTETNKVDASQASKKAAKKVSSNHKMKSSDLNTITSYYSDIVNATIRKDMISHTEVSKKQAKKLVVGKIIPHKIQVVPLPLELEKKLSSLLLHQIRVQVGVRVILMDVKSRRILDVIKI